MGTILMGLSKAYDCISHELLIAKLECYRLNEISLKLILNCLSHRKQRTKIGSSFRSWFDIYVGVPQASVLGAIILNIFINPFQANVLFLYPLKTSENLRFSDVFRGIEREYWPGMG